MTTMISEQDGKTVITLSGRLDTAAAAQLDQQLQTLYETLDRDVLIDCTGLQYIASSGLRVWLRLLKRADASGHAVTLSHVDDVIRDVLEMTGFVKLFHLI